MKLQIIDLLPLVHPFSFYMQDAYKFLNENLIIFCKLNIKDGNVFYTDIYYIYDNNTKNIYMVIYKKKFKKCLYLFNKAFSNYQATY